MEKLLIKPSISTGDLNFTKLFQYGPANTLFGRVTARDDNFYYVANSEGIQVYHYDSINGFTMDSSISGAFYALHKGNTYLYSHGDGNFVRSYSIDVSGNLTEVGKQSLSANCRGLATNDDESLLYTSSYLSSNSILRIFPIELDGSIGGYVFNQFPTADISNNAGGLLVDGSILHMLSMENTLGTNAKFMASFKIGIDGNVSFADIFYSDASENSTAYNSQMIVQDGKLHVSMNEFRSFTVDSSGFYTSVFDYNQGTDSQFQGVTIGNNKIYISDTSYNNILIFDYPNISSPIYTASIDESSTNFNLYLENDNTLIGITNSGESFDQDVLASYGTGSGTSYEYSKFKISPAISTNSSLTEIHNLQTGAGSTFQMDYDGEFLYIADTFLGIQVYHYDETNGFIIDSSISGNYLGVHKGTNYLYASEQTGGNVYVYSVDISGNLTQVGFNDIPQNPRGIVANVDETKLYISETAARISIWDISTNGSLTFQSNYTLDPSVTGGGNMIIDGSILHYVTIDGVAGAITRNISSYLISSTGTLTYSDIFYSDSSAHSQRLPQLKAFNNKLYVAMNEFRIFDVDSSGNYTSEFNYLPTTDTTFMGIDVDSTNIYVSDASASKLYIFDTTNPTTPIFTSGNGALAADLNIFATSVNNIIGINDQGYLAKYAFVNSDPGEISKLILKGTPAILPPDSSANDILTWSFPEQTGGSDINATTHTVDVSVEPYTDISALTPTFTISPGATSNPATGVEDNYENPPTPVGVTAEDSTLQNWLINVKVEVLPLMFEIAATGSQGAVELASASAYHSQTFEVTSAASNKFAVTWIINTDVFGSPDTTLEVLITGVDASNEPSIGNILYTSSEIDSTTFTGFSPHFIFNDVSLNTGTLYGLVLRPKTVITLDNSNKLTITGNTINTYPIGNAFISTNSGNTWASTFVNNFITAFYAN